MKRRLSDLPALQLEVTLWTAALLASFGIWAIGMSYFAVVS